MGGGSGVVVGEGLDSGGPGVARSGDFVLRGEGSEGGRVGKAMGVGD